MLDGLISGSGGKTSCTRFITVMSAAVLLSVYVAHNVAAIINSSGIVGFNWTDASLLAAILGVKALQTFAEVPTQKDIEGI